MARNVDFSEMLGATLTAVEGLSVGSEFVTFSADDGRKWVMQYHHDCCALCSIEDLTGDVADIIGSPLTMAEEVSNADEPAREKYDQSWTWTYYKLATVKGYLTIRWYGESNGYYSEEVSFSRVGLS